MPAHRHVTPSSAQKPTTANIKPTNTAQNTRKRLYNPCMLRLPDNPGELAVDMHHVTHRQAINREIITIHTETIPNSYGLPPSPVSLNSALKRFPLHSGSNTDISAPPPCSVESSAPRARKRNPGTPSSAASYATHEPTWPYPGPDSTARTPRPRTRHNEPHTQSSAKPPSVERLEKGSFPRMRKLGIAQKTNRRR